MESVIDADVWLEEVYKALAFEGENCAGIKIYKTLISLLFDDHNIAVVDKILSKVNVDRINSQIALAFLTSTNTHRKFLKEYASCYDKVEAKIRAEFPERCNRIMIGLKPVPTN